MVLLMFAAPVTRTVVRNNYSDDSEHNRTIQLDPCFKIPGLEII
jgi:hypothetical protein